MSFWAHVDELRGVLIKGAALVVALCVVLFAFMPAIFHVVILAPCRADFPLYVLLRNIPAISGMDGVVCDNMQVQLLNMDLAAPLLLHFSTAFWLSVLICVPVLLALVYSFVNPGLYDTERRYARVGVVALSGMFYIGVIVGYMLVFPLTLRFLYAYQVSADVPNVISLNSYMHTMMMLCLCMGLVFELPLVAWILGKCGILHREFFSRYRRHAVVALLIMSAIITPTSDPFTLMVVFLPVYILWEAGALLVARKKNLIE